jgi:hypothetical protein
MEESVVPCVFKVRRRAINALRERHCGGDRHTQPPKEEVIVPSRRELGHSGSVGGTTRLELLVDPLGILRLPAGELALLEPVVCIKECVAL